MVLDVAYLGVRIVHGVRPTGFVGSVAVGAGGCATQECPVGLADNWYFSGRVDSHSSYGHYGAVLAVWPQVEHQRSWRHWQACMVRLGYTCADFCCVFYLFYHGGGIGSNVFER